jgi:Tol biopolymer transport system component
MSSPPTLLLYSAANPSTVPIYFTSDRTGHKEIWMMDPDGKINADY